MGKKIFWFLMMLGSIVLFGATVALGYYLFPDDHVAAWSFFVLLLLFHAVETFYSIRIGRIRRVSTLRSVVLTLIFGFTWWLPLKKGIISG